MTNGILSSKRSKRGLYWGLFLLLLVAVSGSAYRLGLSPRGVVRGIGFLISSSVAGSSSRNTDRTEEKTGTTASGQAESQVLLRSIEKQRQELQERKEQLDRLESRLEQEKDEIIRERQQLEAERSGDGSPWLQRLSRYLPLLVLLSVGLWLGLVFYLVVRRSVGGRPARKAVPALTPPVKLDDNLSALKESLASMISDVEDVAGRVPDEIRQGSMAMKELIREADRRMGELQGLLSQVALVSQREASRSVDKAGERAGESAGSETDAGERNEMVYKLTDEGLTEEEIAKRLDIGIGEVQLILNLKRAGEEGR